MELLQYIKNNSSTFHIRTKEEIDQLFNELSVQKLPIDNKLDFYIRMSIQKVKLQLYYVLKLEEFRRRSLSIKPKKSDEDSCVVSFSKPANEKAKKKEKKRKYKATSIEKQHESEKRFTKEQLIAANKAKVAKFHPGPDFVASSTLIAKERLKIKHEKEMLEKTKNQWTSIVSIPMGGMNK